MFISSISSSRLTGESEIIKIECFFFLVQISRPKSWVTRQEISHYCQGFIHHPRWLGMGFLNHQQYQWLFFPNNYLMVDTVYTWNLSHGTSEIFTRRVISLTKKSWVTWLLKWLQLAICWMKRCFPWWFGPCFGPPSLHPSSSVGCWTGTSR